MMRNSCLSDKKISKSMGRLNQAFSQQKIRIKSLRIKTQQMKQSSKSLTKSILELPPILKPQQGKQISPLKRQKMNVKEVEEILLNRKLGAKSSILLQRDYQKELQRRFSIPRGLVKEIYRLKIEQDQTKYSEQKYLQFCKILYLKVVDRKQLCMQGLNLKGRALERFLQFFLVWREKSVIGLDLSLCSELTTKAVNKRTVDNYKNSLAQQQSEELSTAWPMNSLLLRLIQSNDSNNQLTKLSLRNLHLTSPQVSQLLSQILKSSRISSLDISNKTSQTINRLGNNLHYLENFFAKNQSVAVMKMDNLNIGDQCIEKIAKGLGNNVQSVVKILSLAANVITNKSATYIHNMITKVGLDQLTLSNNPLRPQFYLTLKSLRSNTVRYIDLSSTNMNSQALVNLLTQLSENKSIQTLILDNNDFSNHWFNKVGSIFSSGFSLQQLSMANCNIKNFDQLFKGIQNSKYLTKMNLNYNIVNVESEDMQKVFECFKLNKILRSVKMRYCGYNQPLIIKLLVSLRDNNSLEFLDISENHMSDIGAKHIVRLLNENSTINQIGIEKLQLTVKMIHEITSLIELNQSKRQKKNHINLIDQNKMYKLRDTHSWNEIHVLEQHHKKLHSLCQDVKIKNLQLEVQLKQKRQSLLQFKNSQRLQVIKIDEEIKRQYHLNKSNVRQINQEIDEIEQMQQGANQAIQIERNLILALEHKIIKQNQKIKRREIQLQSMLKDQKHLQSKKDKLQKQHLSQQKQQRIQSPQKGSNQLFVNMRTTQSSLKRKIVINSKKE